MRTNSYNFMAVIFVSAMLLISCNSKPSKDNSESKTIVEKVVNNQDIKPEIEKILYQFPTPFEVTLLLNKAKAAFIFDLTNRSENLEKYMIEQKQALNLGVYSADLAYASTYNHSNETIKLMECTSKLCDELGITGIYNQNLIDIIKENANDKDTLVKILTNVFDQTRTYLSKTNREKISVFIASGGFIETLYLATSLNVLTDNNQEITEIIYLQKDTLAKLLNVLDAFSSDKDIEALKLDMEKVDNFYANYPLPDSKKLSPEIATELNKLIEKIRTGLVK